MQLAGPGVFGPPQGSRRGARRAARGGGAAASTISTPATSMARTSPTSSSARRSRPYPDDLVIVTKIGARRGADGSWLPAFSPQELTQAVHDNLRNLGLDALEVVNLRIMFGVEKPVEGSIEPQVDAPRRTSAARASSATSASATSTPTQIAEARRICEIVCVQNHYNLAHRDDDALIDDLARDGIAYVPFFPARRVHAAAVRPPSPPSPRASARRRCRSRWPGCCIARPTSC